MCPSFFWHLAHPKQLYVTDSDYEKVRVCDVGPPGTLTNCVETVNGISDYPYAIAVNSALGYAYIGSDDGVVKVCALDVATGLLSNCNDIPFGMGFDILDLTFAPNGALYVVLQQATYNAISYCIPDPATGQISNCPEAVPASSVGSPRKITFVGDRAYFTDATTVMLCTVAADNTLTGCAESGAGPLFGDSGPRAIAVRGPHAWVSHYGISSPYVMHCSVDESTGALSNCASATTYFTSAVDEILLGNDGYLYLAYTNPNSVVSCAIDEATGLLSSCTEAAQNMGFAQSLAGY